MRLISRTILFSFLLLSLSSCVCRCCCWLGASSFLRWFCAKISVVFAWCKSLFIEFDMLSTRAVYVRVHLPLTDQKFQYQNSRRSFIGTQSLSLSLYIGVWVVWCRCRQLAHSIQKIGYTESLTIFASINSLCVISCEYIMATDFALTLTLSPSVFSSMVFMGPVIAHPNHISIVIKLIWFTSNGKCFLPSKMVSNEWMKCATVTHADHLCKVL